MRLPLGRLSRPPKPTKVVGGYPPFAVMTARSGGHDVFVPALSAPSIFPSIQIWSTVCSRMVLRRHVPQVVQIRTTNPFPVRL
jgi:hypothetical protein